MAGTRVIVTGSSGIAAALIRALNSRDESIYIIGGTDNDSSDLKEQCHNIKGFSSIDLRTEEDSQRGFRLANETLGGIDHVVGVVGGSGRSFGDSKFDSISLQGWNETLSLNLNTAFLTLREGIRTLLPKGGSITLTSSVLANHPVYDKFSTHAYATSKYAIEGMVRLAATAYIEQKIRVNAVAPGLVTTPMSFRATNDPEIQKFIQMKQPLSGGQLKAEDVISAYLYCMDNPSISGEILTVDGGWKSVIKI